MNSVPDSTADIFTLATDPWPWETAFHSGSTKHKILWGSTSAALHSTTLLFNTLHFTRDWKRASCIVLQLPGLSATSENWAIPKFSSPSCALGNMIFAFFSGLKFYFSLALKCAQSKDMVLSLPLVYFSFSRRHVFRQSTVVVYTARQILIPSLQS